jgi:hypothetical protein
MDRVTGIVTLTLNGHTIFPVWPEIASYNIPLPPLEPRNVLVIEVKAGTPDGQDALMVDEWGLITLVIRPGRSGAEAPDPLVSTTHPA